jgi:hypothetical protein
MTHKKLSGLTLTVLGALALLQVIGVYNFGLAFWPVVILYVGLEIVWGSLFSRHHGPSLLGAALGFGVGALGLVPILANAGVAPFLSYGQLLRLGWPVLLIALGVALLFGPRRWRWHIDWQ